MGKIYSAVNGEGVRTRENLLEVNGDPIPDSACGENASLDEKVLKSARGRDVHAGELKRQRPLVNPHVTSARRAGVGGR